MRKQQLIQLLQFIFAWILVWLFVVFVMEKSFVDFVLKYWLYLLIVSVSYFYYYSIQYEPDKKYELIRNVLIYGNAYLFLHIFFRPQLNISHQLFVLLGLIALGLRWTTKLRTRWRYLLQIVGGIFVFFIMISGMFYFYPDAPDIEGFLKGRSNEIRILGVGNLVERSDAYIKITDSKGSSDFDIVSDFTRMLSEDVRIAYPSLSAKRDENLIVMTPQGDLVWILPQSEASLEFSGDALKIVKKLNGKIGFLSGIFESSVKFLGDDSDLSSEEKDWLEGAQDVYKHEFVSYLKSQISESKIWLANNTIMYNIDGKIISFLSKMFPVTFGKNKENYNEFQKYFSWFDDGVDLGRFSINQGTGESISSFWGSLEDNIGAGKSNTYGRFKKPKKR